VTYCRICPATCGLVVDVDDGRVVRAVGDPDNPLTRGFSCPKGRRIGDFLSVPDRLRACLRRDEDGRQVPVEADRAVEEIATRLRAIIDEHGPDSVAFLGGTQDAMSSLTAPFSSRWFAGTGSRKLFSTMTIDQAAKWVADGRIGTWAAGRQRFEDADVWMLVGTNPVISMQGGYFTGFPIHDPVRRLQEAQARGMRLIVVDPRRTEVAARADLHLQIAPGADALLFAAMLSVILGENLHDSAFCARWVDGVAELAAAVAPFTPAAVAATCGVAADDIVAAARTFATARCGMAHSGTGPDMGPQANVTEHLIRCLNVVCGRFPQEGERAAGGGVLGSGTASRGQALSPTRTWEGGYHNRFGYGQLYGQLPVATLIDEILEPGPDRVRALLISGSNPASAVPDQARIIEALRGLELLVTVDPFDTETARLADYVIAPKLHLERADMTRAYESLFDQPFAQWTDPVVDAPPGLLDDWEFWLELAWAMSQTVSFAGASYAPGSTRPSTEEVLGTLAGRARVPLDEVRRHPHGAMFDVEQLPVGPPADGADGRLVVMAPDVAEEVAALATLVDAGAIPGRPFRLVVRRQKETINSVGRRVPGLPRSAANPCHVHPDDLATIGIPSGGTVRITSDHGTVTTLAVADATLRPGAVSLTHGFGGLPGDDDDPMTYGASVSRLLSIDHELQPVSGMPLMSAVPVDIVAENA
jgi:anaerobic selenocysteine-containing dehydrogenase